MRDKTNRKFFWLLPRHTFQQPARVAASTTYVDVGSQTFASIGLTGYSNSNDPISSVFNANVGAVTFFERGQGYIIFGSTFYSQAYQDQALVLIHELLHVAFGVAGLDRTDVAVAAFFGISYTVQPRGIPGYDDETAAASLAITEWLKGDCPQ